MRKYIHKWRSILGLSLLFAGVSLSSCDDDNDDNVVGIVPKVTSISPIEGLKPGNEIVILGTDLAEVDEVRFDASYLLEKSEFVSADANQIVLALPDDAPEGELYLISSDETVPNILAGSIFLTKPDITEVSPLEVEAGTLVTVTGTNFDLVQDIMIGSISLSIDNINGEYTELTATCPDDIKAGILKLIMANDIEVEFSLSIALYIPPVVPVVTSIPDLLLEGLLEINGTDLDLVTSVVFPGGATVTEFESQSAYKIELILPSSVQEGEVTITLITPDVEVVSPLFNINTPPAGSDPVTDENLIYYDFNGKDIGWNDLGGTVTDDALSTDGTSFYEVDATVTGDWANYFAQNGGHFVTDGVDVSTHVLRLDLNVLSIDAEIYLKFRLGGFWYIWSVGNDYNSEGTDGWTTLYIPLDQFKDNNGDGVSMTTSDLAGIGEWGLTSGWNGGNIHMRIDNVGFQVAP